MYPLLPIALAALGSVQVEGGPGSSGRIQAAIDACPSAGCTIDLPDADYPLDRQIWIQDRENLTLRATGATRARLHWVDSLLVADSTGTAKLFRMAPPPGGTRPSVPEGWLRWPTAVRGGVGTLSDSTNPYASNGHQHNGMVLVKGSRAIRLEGLVLDGIRPAVFLNENVWGGLTDLVHGSVGVAVYLSRGVEIVGCDLRNHWAAVYMNDRNDKCAGWTTEIKSKFWSACGLMGGHLVEGNRIHGNKFGIYSETAWDLGSVMRDNVAWDNRERSEAGASVTPKAALASPEHTIPTGGFLLVKDVVFPVHVVSHNTIADTGASRPYGGTGYRATANALWSDNLIELRSPNRGRTGSTSYDLQDNRHLWTNAASPHLWNSAILTNGGDGVSTTYGLVSDSTVTFQKRRNDSTTFTARCWEVCGVRMDPPLAYFHCGATQIWFGTMQGKDTIETRYIIPDDSSVHVGKVWISGYADSTSRYRLPIPRGSADTMWAWERNLVLSANALLKRADTTSPSFLSFDTTTHGSRDALRLLGARRAWPGASGPRGLHQEPVRLRARGHGRWDKTGNALVLPVGIGGELAGVSKLVIRNAWIAARPLNQSEVDMSANNLIVERRIATTSLPEIAPTDTVIRIPFTDAGSDNLYQVDLWFSAVSGADTLEVTPMAWSVAKSMTSSFNTTSVERGQTVQWLRRGRLLYVHGLGNARTLGFIDARGARVVLAVGASPRGPVVDLSGLPTGIWFPAFEGARPLTILDR